MKSIIIDEECYLEGELLDDQPVVGLQILDPASGEIESIFVGFEAIESFINSEEWQKLKEQYQRV